MPTTSLLFDGMVCDNGSGLPIGGAQCQIVGSYGYTTNVDGSNASDGGFLCVNSGAPGNAFWYAASANDDPTEQLYLYVQASGYESIQGLPVGDVLNHDEGQTYWMKSGQPGSEPESAEDLGLNFQTEPVKTEPVIGAPAIAWVGEWTSGSNPQHPAWVHAAIVLAPGSGFIPVYGVDITDQIFGDTVHDEAVGHTLGRAVPSKLRLGGRSAPRTARALPGIHFLRSSVRAVRRFPSGAPDAIQNVLPDLTKIERRDSAFAAIHQFAVELGVLCDSLRLSNGVVLQLYGVYAAQGHNLVDYAIRYRREGPPGGFLKVDLMLGRYIEPPA